MIQGLQKKLRKLPHFVSVFIGLVSLIFTANQADIIHPNNDNDDSNLFNIAHADVPADPSCGGDSSGCCGSCGAGCCASGGSDASSADSGDDDG